MLNSKDQTKDVRSYLPRDTNTPNPGVPAPQHITNNNASNQKGRPSDRPKANAQLHRSLSSQHLDRSRSSLTAPHAESVGDNNPSGMERRPVGGSFNYNDRSSCNVYKSSQNVSRDSDQGHSRKRTRTGSPDDDNDQEIIPDDDMLSYEEYCRSLSPKVPQEARGPTSMAPAPKKLPPKMLLSKLLPLKIPKVPEPVVPEPKVLESEVISDSVNKAGVPRIDGVASWKKWCADIGINSSDQVNLETFWMYITHFVRLKEKCLLIQRRGPRDFLDQPTTQDSTLDEGYNNDSILDTCVIPVLGLWRTQSKKRDELAKSTQAKGLTPKGKETRKDAAYPGSCELEELQTFITDQALALNLNITITSRSSSFMEYGKASGSSSSTSSSSRNYPPMPVVDTTIVERLRQAQLEARQNQCVPGLLTDPLLVTVLESLMSFVQAASQSQWCPNSSGLAQRASVRTFPSTIPLERPRMQGSTRINEPTTTVPRPVARAVTNPIPASASASTSASTSASALASASVPTTSRGKEPKHSYRSQSETEARTKKSSKKKKRRNRKQGSSDERPLYPFNEDARSIPDVWKEWTVGWKGGPALKDLVGAGMAFDRKNYGRHYRMTRAKKIIAESMEDAVAQGKLTLDQAIINMEKYRGTRHPWTITQKPDFDSWITGEPPVDGRSAEARRKKKEKEREKGAVARRKNRKNASVEEVDVSEDEGEDESDGDASYVDSEDESYDEGEEQDDDEGEEQDVDESEEQDSDEEQYGDERVGEEQERSQHGDELREEYEDPTDLHETEAGDPDSVIVISDEDTAMDGPAPSSSPLRFYQKQEPVSATFPGAYSRVSDRGYYRDGQYSSLFGWPDSENVLPDDET